MNKEKTGRKVLLIIDVQDPFVGEKTREVVGFLQELLQREQFQCVIQSCWQNHSGSRYETQLGYEQGREAKPAIHWPDAQVLVRSTYSALNEELRRLLRKEDEIYVAGLETDACVLATLFGLWDGGFSFRVYRKGVGTNREDLAEPALALIRRQFGEGVLL